MADQIALSLYISNPAFWVPSGNDSGSAPQLKGARWFSYDELKKCTNNFSMSNEVGSGGYGKVNVQMTFAAFLIVLSCFSFSFTICFRVVLSLSSSLAGI